MKIGSSNISKIYLGANEISKAYRGGTLIYSASSYDADLLTYISGLATPLSADILGKINDIFVVPYKSDDGLTNLSDAYDVMYYLANETAESSLRNLVKRAHDAVAVNSPTFTPYEGWAGDGISSYIDTNYNPATEGSKYTLNNCSLGIYSRTDSAGTYCDIGSRTDTTNYTGLFSRLATGIVAHRIHNVATISVNGTVADSLGMNIVTRNAAAQTGLFGYKNKVQLSNSPGVGNTTSIPNGNFYISARNLVGTGAETLSPRQYALAFAGNHRAQESVNYLYDRFQALMTANGKQV